MNPNPENGTSGANGNETHEIVLGATDYIRGHITIFTMALYQIISAILILNLLIAAMNTTVARLEKCKERNYNYYATRQVPNSNLFH